MWPHQRSIPSSSAGTQKWEGYCNVVLEQQEQDSINPLDLVDFPCLSPCSHSTHLLPQGHQHGPSFIPRFPSPVQCGVRCGNARLPFIALSWWNTSEKPSRSISLNLLHISTLRAQLPDKKGCLFRAGWRKQSIFFNVSWGNCEPPWFIRNRKATFSCTIVYSFQQ